MIKAIDCCWMLTVFFRYAPRHTRSPLALISTMPGRPKRKAVGDTAQKAKKARGETDLKWDLKWSNAGKPDKNEIHPVIILSSSTLDGSEKIAGFDIDWTVIQTSSGRKFATGAKDWDWWNEAVPDKLRKLNEDGYRVMFFTNQAGIEKQKVKPREIMTKIEDIIEKLDIPILAFISTGTTHFRKPGSMMWDYMVENCNNGKKPNLSKCLYVGDAAGRAKEWAPGKPKDFSCSDRMFAANIGIDFKTPEEFFLEEDPAPFQWGAVDPKEVLTNADKGDADSYHSSDTELIVMVGCPASGKSTFSKRFLVPHRYTQVNRDTLATAEKCFKTADLELKAGRSVVVDNTNPAASTRADYVQLAKKYGVPCRCFVMETPLDLAHHLNMVRMNQTNGEVRRIPDVGYNMYKKNFEDPKLSEGFAEIKKLKFSPKFDSKRDENLFKQWTN